MRFFLSALLAFIFCCGIAALLFWLGRPEGGSKEPTERMPVQSEPQKETKRVSFERLRPHKKPRSSSVIAGKVLDQEGKPLWRATVRLLFGPYQELKRKRTQRDGSFEFSGLDSQYVYSVEASTGRCAPVRVDNVEVGNKNLVITLKRGGRISGTCLSDDVGMPIRNFTVILQGPVSKKVEVNDPDGLFRIDGLPGGRYRVILRAPGYLESEGSDLLIEEGKEVRKNFFLVPQKE